MIQSIKTAPVRVVETSYMLVSSGILAYVIGGIRKDVGSIFLAISAVLLTLYAILLMIKRKKGRE
ncbi:hypothetical protein ERY13_16980 [Paenibacillus mucilaginosus]|nr:hypothetical protein ERY13_16980 [Paenibacillus mucilaginosus]